ncbi:MAG TPA: TatD family hydrolase [Chthoniobacterales bacterium]
MLADTHAHLDFPEFADDLPAVLARAAEAEVHTIITIGTDLDSSRRAIALAERHPGVFAAVGVHPNHVEPNRPDSLDELAELARHPKVVAIGETGFDYHYLPSRKQRADVVQAALGAGSAATLELEIKDEAVKAAQARVFEQQLELAAEFGKNVIIHQRDAWADTLATLRRHPVRGVFHCFSGNLAQAEELVALGHLVSFTGLVTFKNAPEARAVSTQLPLNQFMVETDAPYLAPVPHRGQRCEPAFVRRTAESIARDRGITLAEFAAQTTKTARSFFGLKQ